MEVIKPNTEQINALVKEASQNFPLAFWLQFNMYLPLYSLHSIVSLLLSSDV